MNSRAPCINCDFCEESDGNYTCTKGRFKKKGSYRFLSLHTARAGEKLFGIMATCKYGPNDKIAAYKKLLPKPVKPKKPIPFDTVRATYAPQGHRVVPMESRPSDKAGEQWLMLL